MARSGRRDKAEGWFDKLAGRMTKFSGLSENAIKSQLPF